MNKYKKTNRTSQQIKKEQINFLLEDVEKNLEEYKTALKSREKQLSYAKKLLVSAKNSYDRTVAENKELKAYIQNIKQPFKEYQQRQQAQFLENQKNYHEKTQPKRYKKVAYEEKPDSEPELEEEEYCADKKEEEPEIKKKKKKKRAEKRKYFALYKQGCKEK